MKTEEQDRILRAEADLETFRKTAHQLWCSQHETLILSENRAESAESEVVRLNSKLCGLAKELAQVKAELETQKAKVFHHSNRADTQMCGRLQAEARIAQLQEVLMPFTHEDLCGRSKGEIQDGDHPVYQRNKAILLRKHFRAARDVLG